MGPRYLIKPMVAKAFLRELRTVLQQWAEHAPADVTYEICDPMCIAAQIVCRNAQIVLRQITSGYLLNLAIVFDADKWTAQILPHFDLPPK